LLCVNHRLVQVLGIDGVLVVLSTNLTNDFLVETLPSMGYAMPDGDVGWWVLFLFMAFAVTILFLKLVLRATAFAERQRPGGALASGGAEASQQGRAKALELFQTASEQAGGAAKGAAPKKSAKRKKK
jgi:hypothetical protein